MLKFSSFKRPHLYVFGAGGTGGFALENLTRLFAGSNEPITIDVFDGDTVELKNLKRQNFTPADLDKPKVTALIQRLQNQVSKAPHFIGHDQYVTDADELMATLLTETGDDESAIILMAVDNIATRRLIDQTIAQLADALPIVAFDSGNDDQGGQVVAFANFAIAQVTMAGQTSVTLPNMLQLFPEIDHIDSPADENPGIVMNCADEAESKPQAMFNNVRNGELLAHAVYQLIQTEQLPGNVWFSAMLDLTTKVQTKGVLANG